jgi:asparagine synthase (glutamine-hydrolysing)
MCGICGFWNFDGRRVESKDLRRMMETLRHRGPDDEGQLLWDGTRLGATTGKLGLGHKRLSILDLSPSGRQPMSDDAEQIWTVFNGEIYNFQEIATELCTKGCRFRTRTDTEVILYAYREWGIEGISRFNGMFAIALWDRRVGKLHLIRDRLGVKPLYYYRKNGVFAFASELKALLAFPYFEKQLDFDALLQYLIFQYVPGPKSIFRDTWKLMPGHVLSLSNDGQLEDRSYWDLNSALAKRDILRNRNQEEILEELDELLTRSVRYRMISDVPLGAFLSGGIDSSLIVAIMQKLNRKPVRTFSIGFEDASFNEAPYAKTISAHLGTQHQELYVGPRQVSELLPRIVDFYDEPFADTSTIPTMLLSELARSEVTVSLSGDGGDELFGGYTRYKTMARAESFSRVPYALRATASLLARIPSAFLRRHSFWLLPRRDLEDYYLDLMSTWPRETLTQLMGISDVDLSDSVFHRTFREADGRSGPEQASLVDIKTYLVDCILTKLDRASMAVSLEARDPLLDYELVEFAVALPSRWKLQNGTQKYLLKKLLAKYVPPPLFHRPKHGFNMPLSRWLRGELREMAETYLSEAHLAKQGIFEVGAVRRVVSEHFAGTDDHYPKLYSLLIFQQWHSKYMQSPA